MGTIGFRYRPSQPIIAYNTIIFVANTSRFDIILNTKTFAKNSLLSHGSID